MIFLLYFLMLFLNLYFFLLNKKNNMVVIISFLVIGKFLLGTPEVADYIVYEGHYNKINNRWYYIGEKGYNFFEKIGQYFSFSYIEFRFLIIAIILVFLLIVLFSLKVKLHYFLFFYMISNMFIDIAQIRLLFGLPFFLLGIIALLRQSKYISFICICISLSIHALYLFLSIFLILFICEKKNVKIMFFVKTILFLLLIILFLKPEIINFLSIFNNNIAIKINQYLKNRTGYSFILVLIYYMYTSIIYKKYLKTENDLIFFMKKIITYLYSILPIFLINLNFYRIFRIFLIITIIIFSKEYYKVKNKYSFTIIFFFYCIYWLILDFYSSDIFNRIIICFLVRR